MVPGSEISTWVDLLLRMLAAIGGIGGIFATLAVALMRRTFATKDDVQKRFDDHADEHDEITKRLAEGENRFVELSGGIRAVELAAHQATGAANKAAEAADKVHDVQVDIATLRGQISSLDATIQPIQHFTTLMVEGHMKIGERA